MLQGSWHAASAGLRHLNLAPTCCFSLSYSLAVCCCFSRCLASICAARSCPIWRIFKLRSSSLRLSFSHSASRFSSMARSSRASSNAASALKHNQCGPADQTKNFLLLFRGSKREGFNFADFPVRSSSTLKVLWLIEKGKTGPPGVALWLFRTFDEELQFITAFTPAHTPNHQPKSSTGGVAFFVRAVVRIWVRHQLSWKLAPGNTVVGQLK